jgi:hypothetical protein
MAEKDRIIKSGQFTFSRLLFLAAAGGLVVAMVYLGGVWLSIGYWVITLAICGVLFLVAIDYGTSMDKVSLTTEPAQVGASLDGETPAETTATISREARARRRTTRPAKRRR